MREVVAAGMMIMGVRDPVNKNHETSHGPGVDRDRVKQN